MLIVKEITEKEALNKGKMIMDNCKELTKMIGEDGSPLATKVENGYDLYDCYTQSVAHVRLEEDYIVFQTAMSQFEYRIEEQDGKFYQIYDGAWRGLQAQEICPKSVMTWSWEGCEIYSSLNKKWNGLKNEYKIIPLSWNEYKKLREATIDKVA